MRIRSRRLKAAITSALAFAVAIPVSALALSVADNNGPGILLFGLPMLLAVIVSYWSWSFR
jgi:hypothetical protein